MYCINLKHRKDRWERFAAQPELKELKRFYRFERFEGIVGANLDIMEDTRISLRTKRNIKERIRRGHEELNTAGGVGCYLSHTSLWKEIVSRPEPYAIIFEDDADIPAGFTAKLQAAMQDVTLLPNKPDVWFFKYTGCHKRESNLERQVGPWTQNACSVFTGYMISKQGAEKLLKLAFPIDMHVDMFACLAGEMGNILAVMHKNVDIGLYEVKQFDTDIHSPTECAICEVPTDYHKKGYLVINLPLLSVGLGIVGALWYLSRSGGRGGRR